MLAAVAIALAYVVFAVRANGAASAETAASATPA